MGSEDAPNRESIMGAIVLAFSNSKLKDVVGTDALRSVLSGQYRDMVVGSQLHLQVVWDLLYDQPGFDAEHAKPPFCALKSWEKELHVQANLPSELAALGATEIMAHASHCSVPKLLRQRVINPEAARAKGNATTLTMSEVATSTPVTRKPALEGLLALVGVAGIGFAIYTAVTFMSGAKFEAVSVDEIGSVLPVKSARKLGSDLSIVLSDDAWLEKPDAARSEALQDALTKLKAKNVQVLVIQDASGVIRASAQWTGSPPTIEVRLR